VISSSRPRAARKRRATSPLPTDVREAVIEHLTALLVAEVECNPEAYLRPGCAGEANRDTPPSECAPGIEASHG
jgi:hypothetical protein